MEAAEAMEKEGVSVEVVDLRTVRPIDYQTVINSVQKTNRLVVVEEAWPLSSISTEVSHYVQRHAFDYLDAPIHRITNLDGPLAYASNLIQASLPSTKKTIEAINAVLYRN